MSQKLSQTSQSSQPAISLSKALRSSPKALLGNLKLYNETHEDPSAEDVDAFTKEEELVEKLLDILRSTVKTDTQVFVQSLQVMVTLAAVESCMQKMMSNNVLDVLHEALPSIDQKNNENDVYYNYLFAIQDFCENTLSKRRAGELFLGKFCNGVQQSAPVNIRRSLMGCINAMLQASPENKALLEKEVTSLQPFVSMLKECGDHYLQQQVAEFLFRSKKMFEGKELELFENNVEIAAAFGEIKGKQAFSDHLRNFLKVFNQAQGAEQKVFSLKAIDVHIGEAHEQAETWIDFGAEQASFTICSDDDAIQCDLEYRSIRHLKLSDKTKEVRQVKIKLKTTSEVLREMYDSEKDDWIVFSFSVDDVAYFSKRIAPGVIAVQKKYRTAQKAEAAKPPEVPKETKAHTSPPKLPAKAKAAAPAAAAAVAAAKADPPKEVDDASDSEPERRVTRSQRATKVEPEVTVVEVPNAPVHQTERKPKAQARRESPAKPFANVTKRRRANDVQELEEPPPKHAAIPREVTPGRPGRRSSTSAVLPPARPTLNIGESPVQAPHRTSLVKPDAFDLGDASTSLRLDFPNLLSQGDAVSHEDMDGDDDGSLVVLQKQFETLVAKQKEASRKKGTAKINETMALVQRRLDAFKADASRRREELQSESGARLANLQQELADTKKTITQMVNRFQSEMKESLAALQAVSEQVAQLAHEYETELPRQMKTDEEQALRTLKTEVEAEVHRLDQQLQSAAKDTKTIKLLGQLLSKALTE